MIRFRATARVKLVLRENEEQSDRFASFALMTRLISHVRPKYDGEPGGVIAEGDVIIHIVLDKGFRLCAADGCQFDYPNLVDITCG